MNETKLSILSRLKSLPWKRIALIGAPAVLVLAAALLLAPRSPAQVPIPEATAALLAEAPQRALPSAVPSAVPTETPAPADEGPLAVLQAGASEGNLLVQVLGEDGQPLSGRAFQLSLTYPDGSEHVFSTNTDGRLYRIAVAEGEYRIAMLPAEGFRSAEPVSCQVTGKLEYKPIANVREQSEVKAVTELPVEEVRPQQAEAAQPTAVESIRTPEAPVSVGGDTPAGGGGDVLIIEDDGGSAGGDAPVSEPGEVTITSTGGTEEGPGMTVTTVNPVLNASGQPTYTYRYSLGPNGMLLLADGAESDVMPVEENGSLAYGLRRVVTLLRSDASGVTEVPDGVIPEEPEEGVEYFTEESSQSVSLFNSDGTPLPAYQISASPVVQSVSIPVGWQEEGGRVYYHDPYGNRVTGLKEIDGKLYYFDDSGAKARSLGVDVSYFNGPIDWNQVKAHGIDFAIIRLGGRGWSSGLLYEDGNAYKQMENGGRYLQEARAAGLQIGAYFYSSAVNTNEAVEEASLALEILGGMGLELPLYIDMEYSGEYPGGRADRLSVAERTEIVQAFCTTVAKAGYTPGVYAGQNYWGEALSHSALSGYNIWLASYTVGQRQPAFPWRYDMWQCTSGAGVRGFGGVCDLNVIF